MRKCLLLFLLAVSAAPLWSGIFPKPEMDFEFVYQTEQTPAILPDTSEQIQCDDNQCLQSTALGKYGLQKLYCSDKDCFSIAYQYSPYQQLAIDFADGVKRRSNVFPSCRKLRESFTVTVREADLLVQPAKTPRPLNALSRADGWLSLLIILLTEALAAFAYLTYTDKSYRVIYAVIAANLITIPLTWQVLGNFVTETALLWLFCLLFEALFVWVFNRRHLSLRNAAALSVTVNVTSYSVGTMLSFLITPYLF